MIYRVKHENSEADFFSFILTNTCVVDAHLFQ